MNDFANMYARYAESDGGANSVSQPFVVMTVERRRSNANISSFSGFRITAIAGRLAASLSMSLQIRAPSAVLLPLDSHSASTSVVRKNRCKSFTSSTVALTFDQSSSFGCTKIGMFIFASLQRFGFTTADHHDNEGIPA